MPTHVNFLRLPAVLERRRVCKSTHYNDVAAGRFTRPVRISARCSAWPESEVNALMAAMVAGHGDSQLRTLVNQLEAKRADDVRFVGN